MPMTAPILTSAVGCGFVLGILFGLWIADRQLKAWRRKFDQERYRDRKRVEFWRWRHADIVRHLNEQDAKK